jgi:predicted GIY-YIG superfamily endonuclease
MADDILNTKVISKNNSGFPDYLDFDKLRTEGIAYLGKLAGKIWTDHNVHDPGITILESLCYALLDLGYRTNLPVEDILSRAAGDTTKDNNFFTPAQILGCNPLTITDFRKLLIDIDGVKNAWLEVATDQTDLCRNPNNPDSVPGTAPGATAAACTEYLNGLYHVYIETEKNPDKDFTDAAQKEQYIKDVTCRVKKALMAHRNFCEDFVDVYILCKLEMGVCADIELEADADADKVYLEIAQQVRAFLSPAPQFYTLPQLLDKKLPIEAIFAGRPYNVTESHGFVDTNELEQATLKKEIHLSDVFNVIFQVPGVRKIKNLQLRTCNGAPVNQTGWKFKLPVNHVPDFTIGCSGFQFSKNGRPITIDTAKYKGLLDIKFTNTGKILYTEALPNLDTEIPRGIYRADLGDYYSIQNDFPRVYGIDEGGLPDSAPDSRKAQALQLKGYLLFFDQLLANYISQLKNIRSLFAMSAPETANRHTYFLNGVDSVPDLNKLLRMPATDTDALATGTQGSTLVYPVSKNDLLQWIADNPNTSFDPDALSPYTFGSLAEQEIILQQLKEDLLEQQYTTAYIGNAPAIHYYLLTSSDEFALVSKKYFTTTAAADTEVGTVIYVAGFDENYRTFITGSNRVSFDVELNLVSFAGYLQNIIEDEALYATRRNGFLDHLLSRFAEQFTDFALLSYKQYATEEAATLANIKAKEDLLTHYDDISSNRGKGYDYLENNWNTGNISGFEKTVKYISGIENKLAHSLCNFIVAQYDELFQVNITIGNRAFMALPDKFNSRSEAQETARAVFNALGNPANLSTRYLAHERSYTLQVIYGNDRFANLAATWPTEQQADEVRSALSQAFDPQPRPDDVFVSEYMYRLQLLNNTGAITRTAVAFTTVEQEAQNTLQQSPGGINDDKQWTPVDGATQPGNNLYLVAATAEQVEFIDVTAFKIDIDNTIIGHPDKFTYEVLDRTNAFKFTPVDMFNTTSEAEAHCHSVLALGAIEASYQVGRNMPHQKFTLSLIGNGILQAICATEFDTEEEAIRAKEYIYHIIRNWVYQVIIHKSPYRWKFNYYLGYEENARFTFTSVPDYVASEEALRAAALLHQSENALQVQQNENNILLTAGKKNSDVPVVTTPVQADGTPTVATVQAVLNTQKSISPLLSTTNLQAFDAFVEPDEISRQGLYVYRLVDKDNVYASFSESYGSFAQADEARKKMAAWLRQGAFDQTDSIKKVKYRTKEFFNLFPCEEGTVIEACSCQSKTVDEYVYYFSLPVNMANGANWRSLQHYATPEAARKDFLFFLILLKYAGNLFVDCDNCTPNGKGGWRIYIREVLAESARRFMTEQEAWSNTGIEKFICAVQSGYGFHNYLRTTDCCYSFYLNCGQDFIVHPCKYDTADKRTAVMQELYYRLQRFLESRAFSTQWEQNTLVLLDEKAQPFAKHTFDSTNEQDLCNWVVQLPNQITDSKNSYVEKEGVLYLVDATGQEILQSYNNSFTMETWKAMLQGFACYFPIVVNRNEVTGASSYCIEIKIPGFNTCADDQQELLPCGCGDQPAATEPDCYVAWKSVCCYSSCQQAQDAFAYALRLLLNFEHYQPVFGCECNTFGIALNYSVTPGQPAPNDMTFSGDLVAYNPQCYPTPDSVCDAVNRAKKLTNAEGLHVVEHILLRPHTFDDCNCRQGIGCGEKMRECEFVWKVPDEDPCSTEQDICFVPGADPYSFIATIVLPAWPKRFRTPEGRLLMENILYRSAPAHVLLRILWLAPHDFCCFEGKYKNWRRHLAQKQVCNDNFSVCDFLDLLFRRNFECLTDCTTCGPCSTDEPQSTPCFSESNNRLKVNQNWFVNEVNEVFCWQPVVCEKYQWTPCDQPVITRVPGNVDTVTPVLVEETPHETDTIALAEETPVETTLPDNMVEPVTPVEPITATPATPTSKARFVNSRMAGYRAVAREVIERSNNNPLAVMAGAYFNDPSPTPQKTDTLITKLLENAKPEEAEIKRLSRDMKKDLITAIVWFYLDKISFEQKEIRQIKQSGKTFEKLRKAKIGIQNIYEDWNGTEVKKYEPGVDLDALHELVTGIKK